MSEDFDFEPIPGLPAVPPQGERILWQGQPDGWALAVRAFHVRKVAVYFALLVAWRGIAAHGEGLTVAAASRHMLWIALLGVACMGVLTLLAHAYARSTIYTITSRRVVIRSGVALPVTVNLPFSKIEAAALKLRADGSGDIPLRLAKGNRIAALVLWPNWRPGRFTRPEPMLRCIRGAEAVAGLLAAALSGAPVQPKGLLATGPSPAAGGALPTPAT
ncbi:MAG: photosynthetic complex putative assembly protein PuhB [Phreatobacter sp.]|uniref:photosynthetic complex putative assembly protein PuhB n=1 Tax=Phreatobacter sp. TaxID=1966341 RepID=UPI004035CA0E